MSGSAALSIGLVARAYAQDLDGVAEIVKAHPVGADAEAILGRIQVGEMFDIAFLVEQEAGQRLQQMNRGLAVDGADVGTGCGGPDYFLGRGFSRSALMAVAVRFGRGWT